MDELLKKQVSRRDFLRLAGIGVGLGAVGSMSGCATLLNANTPKLWYDRGLVLANCNVIDVVNGTVIPGRSLLIRNDRIAAIASPTEIPTGNAEVIDLQNRFVCPGLIDAHCHTTTPGAAEFLPSTASAILNQLKRNYTQHIMSGTTTVRDMGGFILLLRDRIKEIESGKLVGPRLVICNKMLNIEGGHPDFDLEDVSAFGGLLKKIYGAGSARFKTMEELRQSLQMNLDFKATFIKLTMDNVSLITCRGEIPVYNEEHLKEIVAFSEKHGLPISCHVHFGYGLEQTLKLPVNSIEHIPGDRALTDAEVETMRSRNIAIVPTMSLAQMLAHEEEYDELPAEFRNDYIREELKLQRSFINSDMNRYCDPEILSVNRQVLSYYKRYSCAEREKKRIHLTRTDVYFGILKYAPENFKRLREAGVLVGCGTDAGIPYVYHGTIWREIEMFVRLGYSTREALRCATINNAKILRLDDRIGSVEEGKLADLAVYAENPFDRIETCRRPLMVLRDGKVLHSESMMTKIGGSVYL